jgi:hypothetical protein
MYDDIEDNLMVSVHSNPLALQIFKISEITKISHYYFIYNIITYNI